MSSVVELQAPEAKTVSLIPPQEFKQRDARSWSQAAVTRKKKPPRGSVICPPEWEAIDLAVISPRDELLRLFCVLRFLVIEKQIAGSLNLEFGNDDAFEVIFYKDVKSAYDALVVPDYQPDNFTGEGPDLMEDRDRASTSFESFSEANTASVLTAGDIEIYRWHKLWSLLVNESVLDHHEKVVGFPRTIALSLEERQKYETLLLSIKQNRNQKLFATCHRALKALRLAELNPAFQHPHAFWHKVDSLCAVLLFRESYVIPSFLSAGQKMWVEAFTEHEQERHNESARKTQQLMTALQMPSGMMYCAATWTVRRIGRIVFGTLLALIIIIGLSVETSRGHDQYSEVVTNNTRRAVSEYLDSLDFSARSIFAPSTNLVIARAMYEAGDFGNLSFNNFTERQQLFMYLSSTLDRNPTMQGIYFGSHNGDYAGCFKDSSGESDSSTFWELASNPSGCAQAYHLSETLERNGYKFRIPNLASPALGCDPFVVNTRPWFQNGTKWTAPYNWQSRDRVFSSITVSHSVPLFDGLGVFAADYSLSDISTLLLQASEGTTFGYLVDSQGSVVAASVPKIAVSPAKNNSITKISRFARFIDDSFGSIEASVTHFENNGPVVIWEGAADPYGLVTGKIDFAFGNLTLYGIASLDITMQANDRTFCDTFGLGCIVVGIISAVVLMITLYSFRLPTKGGSMPTQEILGVCVSGLKCKASCQKFESMDGTAVDLEQKDCGICGHRGIEHIKSTEVVVTPEMHAQNKRRFLLSVAFAVALVLASLALTSVAINWYSTTTLEANRAIESLIKSRVRLLSSKVSGHLDQATSVLHATKFRVESGVFQLPLFGGNYDIGLRATKGEEARNVSAFQSIFDVFDPFMVSSLLVLDNSIFYFVHMSFPDDTFMGAIKDGETGFTLIGSQDPFNTCYSRYVWDAAAQKRDVSYRIWQQPACNFYPTKQRWWKDAAITDDVVFGYPYFGLQGKLLVTASLAIRNSFGDPIAVVGVDLDLEGFNSLLQKSKLGTSEATRSFVLQYKNGAQFGSLIASSDAEVVAQTPDGSWVVNNSTESSDDFTQDAANYVLKANFDAKEAAVEPIQFQRALGSPLTSVFVLDSQNWLFVILGEWEEFYGPLNREASFMFVVVAGLVLTLVIASILGYTYLQAFGHVHESRKKLLDTIGAMGSHYGLGMSPQAYAELIKFSREIQIVKGAAVHTWREQSDLKRSGKTSADGPLAFSDLSVFFTSRAREIFRNAKVHRNILTLATMEFRSGNAVLSPHAASNLYLLFTHKWYAHFVDLCTAALLLMVCFEPATIEDLKTSFPASVYVPSLLLYLVLVFDTIVRMTISYGLKGRNSMDPSYAFGVDVALCVVLGLSFIDFLVKISARVSIEYIFPLRPFVALLSSEGILSALISFVVGCYKSRHALLLLALTVLIASCIGTQLFKDVPELSTVAPAHTTFATFFDAILNTYVFIGSGENYTELVYPVLTGPGFKGIKIAFFIICTMLGMFVIVSFILGEFQTAVTQSRQGQLKFELLEERASYIAAFLLLDLNHIGIPLHEFASFLVSISPDINAKEVIKIFHRLDKDSDGQINLSEFLDAVELYLDLDPHYSFEGKTRKAEPLRQLIRDRLIFNTENSLSFLDQFALSVLVVQIWIYAVFASIDPITSPDTEWWLDFANVLCVVLFVIEIWLKLFALGWHGYWNFRMYKEYHNLERTQFAMRLDLIFVAAAVLISIPTAIVAARSGSGFEAVRLPLSVTLLRAFSLVRRVNGILFVVYKVLRSIWDVAMLFLIFFYVWAVIGILLLGRQLRETLLDDAPEAQFIDFPSALLALFQLMVGESWHEVMNKSILATNYYICVFFVSWNFFVTILLSNVFIGILLSSAQNLSGRERLSKRDMQKCFLQGPT